MPLDLYRQMYEQSRSQGVSLSSYIEKRLVSDDANVELVNHHRFQIVMNALNNLSHKNSDSFVTEFLKEIAVRIDPQIPSIVRARIQGAGGVK